MDVAKIIDGVPGAVLRRGERGVPITSITYDSRQVGPGTLFVALPGERFDGHEFVEAAIEAGAAAVLVEEGRDGPWEGTVLEVGSTRGSLARLGSVFYQAPSSELKVLGITGTNGKTTCTYLLEALFQAAGYTTGVIGTVEYRWADRRVAAPNTTPDGLVLQSLLRRMADDGVEVVVMEVSSHGLASGRVDEVVFQGALFTNLSQDHLDFHRTMEEYRDAKRLLFTKYLPAAGESAVAVVNADDQEGEALAALMESTGDVQVVTYGFSKASAVQGRSLRSGVDGVSFEVRAGEETFAVASPMPGGFNAENVLGVTALAKAMGVPVATIRRGLEEFSGVPGRMERVVGLADGPVDGPAVFVDYAHTPDALKRALMTLRPLTRGRLWVVFGCGGDRDRGKRPVMGAVAAEHADLVHLTSDNPRREEPSEIIEEIGAGIDEGQGKVVVNVERREAIELAVTGASGDDVVLIAGKGHETYQEIRGERRDFDDREVAAAALRSRGATP